MPQLRDKHGRHAVNGRRPFCLDSRQHRLRIESVIRQNQGAPAGERRHGADHVAEAVRERHRQTDAIALGVAQHACAQKSVVEDIAMTQQHSLGRTRGAGRVLNIRNVVDLDAFRRCLRFFSQQGLPSRRVKINRVAQRKWIAVVDRVEHFVEHRRVVRLSVALPQKQSLHAGIPQDEPQLMRPAGRIDVHQNRPGARARHVHHQPFPTVHGPHTDAVRQAGRPASSGRWQRDPPHPTIAPR